MHFIYSTFLLNFVISNINLGLSYPVFNAFGLSNLRSYFQNIIEGNEQVSGFDLFRGIYQIQREFVHRNVDPEKALKYNIERGSVQRQIPSDTPFPCDISKARSMTTPTTVHELRPGDIDIIAAMGDSMSAGNSGITTSFIEISYESRGITFTGGGRENWRRFLTLPNILKVYNPNLYGYAIADGLAKHATSRLNVAEPTLMSRDLPFQAQVLIKRMRSDPNIDMQQHWKLLTIFIGSVDLCADLCYYDDVGIPLRKHENDLIETLRLLRDNIPRLYVNLLTPINPVPPFSKMKNVPFACAIIQRFFCGCVLNATYDDADRKAYEEKVQLWQDLDAHIAELPEFQTDEFAVVFQPFVVNLNPPLQSNGEADLRYFASDCFHLSQLSNSIAALGLWNNMIQPLGQKKMDFSFTNESFECPTAERPYLATIKNSHNHTMSTSET